MKNIILSLITIALVTTCSSCKKWKITEPNGLPKITQVGKNTFGFLLNGQPWTPDGFNGTANLSLNYDATFSGGVFNLGAYRILKDSPRIRQRITLYGDSIQYPQKIILPNHNKFGMIFRNDISGCDYDLYDSSSKIESGYVDIQKIDKTNGIFSGQFEIKITKSGCEDVLMTQGRFDMKF